MVQERLLRIEGTVNKVSAKPTAILTFDIEG